MTTMDWSRRFLCVGQFVLCPGAFCAAAALGPPLTRARALAPPPQPRVMVNDESSSENDAGKLSVTPEQFAGMQISVGEPSMLLVPSVVCDCVVVVCELEVSDVDWVVVVAVAVCDVLVLPPEPDVWVDTVDTVEEDPPLATVTCSDPVLGLKAVSPE